ncbi:MAG TPA: hypothetical protein VLA21_05475, partial [Candidatus Limnocylindria bacterium]|nr:hypothetical protein [Candidatus Limnocylindria bacterium]
MRRHTRSPRPAAFLAALLAALLCAGTAFAEVKSVTRLGPYYLGLNDQQQPTVRQFAGPAIPASAVISKVRVEITGQKNAGDGPSADATYLSVKVHNTTQTFMFTQGVTTTIGKDYTSVAGLSPDFSVQVTGHGMMVHILMSGPWVSTTTTVHSVKITVTYSATYTVTWMNGGIVLETDTNLPYQSVPRYDGPVPSRAPDAQYT